MGRPSRYVHDDQLGYVPRPDHSELGLRIDSASLRMNSPWISSASSSPSILAVGDSFTFGEEVTDQETWPSKLQHRTGQPVLNGGVSGYGLDQIILRAEILTELHKPKVIVVAFIADDINRTEMRRLWWRNKPWFTITSGILTLNGTPVPAGVASSTILRSARPLELVLRRLPPSAQHWLGYHLRVHPKGTGIHIASLLIERLASLRRTSGAHIILIAQYDANAWDSPTIATRQRSIANHLLVRAQACGLHVLDSFSLFASAQRPRRLYGAWHLNERGNGMIASLVNAALPH